MQIARCNKSNSKRGEKERDKEKTIQLAVGNSWLERRRETGRESESENSWLYVGLVACWMNPQMSLEQTPECH